MSAAQNWTARLPTCEFGKAFQRLFALHKLFRRQACREPERNGRLEGLRGRQAHVWGVTAGGVNVEPFPSKPANFKRIIAGLSRSLRRPRGTITLVPWITFCGVGLLAPYVFKSVVKKVPTAKPENKEDYRYNRKSYKAAVPPCCNSLILDLRGT